MKRLFFCLLAAGFLGLAVPAHAGMISAAEKLEGLHERSDRAKLKKILGVDPARTPWCGYAMAYFAKKAGYDLPEGHGKARSWAKAGKKISQPKRGDVVVLRRHVGLFTRAEGKRVCLLGGNQGNGVRESCYPRGSVVAYRRMGKPATTTTTAAAATQEFPMDRVALMAGER